MAQADISKPHVVLSRYEYAQEEGNVFAVTATADKWIESTHIATVTDLTDLDRVLAELIGELGCTTALLPFRVEGIATSVNWSIERNPEKMTETYENEPVVLVGFFHQLTAKVFLPWVI